MSRIAELVSPDADLIDTMLVDDLGKGLSLLNARRFVEAEELLAKSVQKHPNDDLNKAYLAWSLIEQHKLGWAEIVADLQVSAVDPKAKAVINYLIVIIGRKFKNHTGTV